MPFPRPLTKSLYVAGMQCARRLWLEVHAPESATPPGEFELGLRARGESVGRAAHALFPGGVLVDTPAQDHAAAVVRTRALVEDGAVPALFEAAFRHAGVDVRVDVLERLADGRFGLREVKSSSKPKPGHADDLAVQRFVVEGSGLALASTELVHVDGDYALGADASAPSGAAPIDWPAYFARVEMRDALDADPETRPEGVAGHVSRLHAEIASPAPPAVEPGSHCRRSQLCPYWAHCTADKGPAWAIGRMRGDARIRERRLHALATGERWVSTDLAAALAPAAPPVWHLDFEALGSAIPLYPGTHPNDHIAFQWSLHGLDADDRIEHLEFLADGDVDPRPAVAETLVAALSGDARPIVSYSPYEARMLRDLAEHVPDRAAELDALRSRLVDLLPIVRGHVYDAGFGSSYSIKSVAPVLAPHVTYADLEDVADGGAAMQRFEQLVDGALTGDAAERAREGLLRYCERDTFALMEVHRALRAIA